jgi:hypothetical protein
MKSNNQFVSAVIIFQFIISIIGVAAVSLAESIDNDKSFTSSNTILVFAEDQKSNRKYDKETSGILCDNVESAIILLLESLGIKNCIPSNSNNVDSAVSSLHPRYLLRIKVGEIKFKEWDQRTAMTKRAVAYGLFGFIGGEVPLHIRNTPVLESVRFDMRFTDVKSHELLYSKEHTIELFDTVSIRQGEDDRYKAEIAANAFGQINPRIFSFISNIVKKETKPAPANSDDGELYDPLITIVLKNDQIGHGYLDTIAGDEILFRKSKYGPRISLRKAIVHYLFDGIDTIYHAP